MQVFGPDPDLMTQKVQRPGLLEEFSEGITGDLDMLKKIATHRPNSQDL